MLDCPPLLPLARHAAARGLSESVQCSMSEDRAVRRHAYCSMGAIVFPIFGRVATMSIDRLGSELEALGVSGHSLRCLLLLPQIYVGWASQRRRLPALEALLDSSAEAVDVGPEGLALVRGWLFDEPTRAQFQSGFALLRVLQRAPGGSAIASSDVLTAVLWAARAASFDREPLEGELGAVSPAAWRALVDLEAWLEVDLGGVVTDLLADGDEREARSTRFDELSERELKRGTALLEVEDAGDVDEEPVSAPSGDAPFPLVRRLPPSGERAV